MNSYNIVEVLNYEDTTSYSNSTENIPLTNTRFIWDDLLKTKYAESAHTSVDALKSTESLLNNLPYIETGLLPPGVRYNLPGLVIFERPPDTKLMQIIFQTMDNIDYDDDDAGRIYTYQIPVPWQLYIATYSNTGPSKYRILNLYMYYTNGPLTSLDNEVYLPAIPNIFTNGAICPPRYSSSDDINRYPQNVSGVIAAAYDWVWNSGFNVDLVDSLYETVSQKNANDPKLINVLNSGRHACAFKLYQVMQTYTIEDIMKFKFANPSYSSYYSEDLNSSDRDTFIDEYVHEYCYEYEIDLSQEDVPDEAYDQAHAAWNDQIKSMKNSKKLIDILNFNLDNDEYFNRVRHNAVPNTFASFNNFINKVR